MKLIYWLFALLIIGITPASAHSLSGNGPIEFRTQSPIQSLRYAAKVDDPRRQADGFNQYSFHVNGASIWTQSPEYKMDYYTFDYQIEWEHHWHDGWKTELSFSQRNTNESRLDQMTLTFHKIFGYDQNGRDDVDKHQYNFWFRDFEIDEQEFQNRTFSQAIELLIAKNLYQDNHQALSVGFTSHVELNDRHAGWDFSFRSDYSYSFNAQHHLYTSIGYSRFRSDNFFNLPLKKRLITLGVSYEYQVSHQRSWLIQYLLNEGATIGLGQLGKPSHELLIGHRWIRSSHTFELALIENLINPDNSADISFSLAYKYRPNL